MYPNLKAEMARAGYTITKLAELMGMRIATLSQKLAGKYHLTLTEAKKIKKILGVDMPLEVLFEEDV